MDHSWFIEVLCVDGKQILTLCNCKEDVKSKVHSVIDKFAERGLRSLAVARQVFLIESSAVLSSLP